MRSLGLLTFALNASLLVLVTQGIQKNKDGIYARSLQRFSVLDRSTGYHLPTYMMHLYRNFKSNFSRPLVTMEQDAAMQADTVKSVVAKSKNRLDIWVVGCLYSLMFCCYGQSRNPWDDGACLAHGSSCQSCAPDDLWEFQSTSSSRAEYLRRDQRVKRPGFRSNSQSKPLFP